MKTRLLSCLFVCFATILSSGYLYSQGVSDINIKGRYIVVEDLNSFFVEIDENIVAESFQLYNIMEDESSKPCHVGVNEVTNVVKFSIESSSSTHENQRRCKLTMNKINYLSTFRYVLKNMEVDFVVYQGTVLTVADFFITIK